MTTGLHLTKSNELWKLSEALIPEGVNTRSKAPSKHIDGVYPKLIDRGYGPYVWDPDGNRYIDYPCGLGTNLLGYADLHVNERIKSILDNGTNFSLPHYMEAKVAERLVELIPCAEQVRFMRTGSEATSAAIKIARSTRGKEKVLACGYHGWHDWYTVTTKLTSGIPAGMADYCEQFQYGELPPIDAHTAAVIMEPCIYEAPPEGYLEKIKALCEQHEALLIFDEVVTGGRFPGGSAQAYLGVTPHLATFGKGLGNGVPVSFVCGEARYMQELTDRCFVSSTWGGELIGLTALDAVLDTIVDTTVIGDIWLNGSNLVDGFNQLAKNHNLNASCIGFPCRSMFLFDDPLHKSLFWQECIERGVLFGYAQFVSRAHTSAVIFDTLSVIDEALAVVSNAIKTDAVSEAMRGKPASEVFRLVAQK